MPKTKKQEVIFCILMIIVMVYAMVCYNIAWELGMSNQVFLMALKELVIMGLIAFVIEFFFVEKAVKQITFKNLDPAKTHPLMITLMISGLTVAFMCPIMSFIATLMHHAQDPSAIIAVWLQTAARNFPMAFFWQIFYAGPFVRFLFRRIQRFSENKEFLATPLPEEN